MSGRTSRFQLTTFDQPTDRRDLDGYKFSDADRRLLDQLLTIAVERHQHTGQPQSASITPPPTLTLASTGGRLPPNTALWYCYALVDPDGREQPPSLPLSIRTPSQLAAPTAPAAALSSGTLMPGQYAYAVSAYTSDSSQETPLSDAAQTPATTTPADYQTANIGWQLTLPAKPPGATGLNIYRRGPTDSEMRFLASATGSTWTDNGSVTADPYRRAPATNTTNTSYQVSVTTPSVLPLGWSVKFFRSLSQGDWSNTLFSWKGQTQVDFDNSDPTTAIDTGNPVRAGGPVGFNIAVGSPPKVDLSGMQGSLPPGLATTPVQIDFALPGPISLGIPPWMWVCEYDQVRVMSVRAAMGIGAALMHYFDVVSVKFQVLRSGAYDWSSFLGGREAVISLTDPANPIGPAQDVSDLSDFSGLLFQGDALGIQITSRGVAAEEMDYDLTVNVLMHAQFGSATTSLTWET